MNIAGNTHTSETVSRPETYDAEFEARNLSAWRGLGYGIPACSYTYILLLIDLEWSSWEDILTFLVYLTAILFFLVGITVSIFKGLQKPYKVKLSGDQLTMNGITLTADEMRDISIRGYFNPMVGIRPKGKRSVPLRLCFRFGAKEDAAMKALSQWAKHYEVPLLHKNFSTWI